MKSLLALTSKTNGSVNTKLYVDDVFSTYSYAGNGSTTIEIFNGIDLAGNGGLVWGKCRYGSDSAPGHFLVDSARPVSSFLSTNVTDAAVTDSSLMYSLNADGFTLGPSTKLNVNGSSFILWTFRKAAKFFDIVTWTGDGVAGRKISHNLGIAPGMIITKATNLVTAWYTYHQALANGTYAILSSAGAVLAATNVFGNDVVGVPATASEFTVGSSGVVNSPGIQYIAYIFAHDPDRDNGIIQCGTATCDADGKAILDLGWEPQYVLWKSTSSSRSWAIADTNRGLTSNTFNNILLADNGGDENLVRNASMQLTSSGGVLIAAAAEKFIYMAIRRSNKPPTNASQVFEPLLGSGEQFVTLPFQPDVDLFKRRTTTPSFEFQDRLRRIKSVLPSSTAAEAAVANNTITWDGQNDLSLGSGYYNVTAIHYFFRRAVGFMDVVAYTGDGSGGLRQITHNLGVKPEFIICKSTTAVNAWQASTPTMGLILNTNAVGTGGGISGYATDKYFTGLALTSDPSNTNNIKYVAYLFASLPGISKVFTYTGNGATQVIPCGFTNGARFVLIKRIDAVDNWYVFDSLRGIKVGAEPYLVLNALAAEVSADIIGPNASGFVVNNDSKVNALGGSYFCLAIA